MEVVSEPLVKVVIIGRFFVTSNINSRWVTCCCINATVAADGSIVACQVVVVVDGLSRWWRRPLGRSNCHAIQVVVLLLKVTIYRRINTWHSRGVHVILCILGQLRVSSSSLHQLRESDFAESFFPFTAIPWLCLQCNVRMIAICAKNYARLLFVFSHNLCVDPCSETEHRLQPCTWLLLPITISKCNFNLQLNTPQRLAWNALSSIHAIQRREGWGPIRATLNLVRWATVHLVPYIDISISYV